MRLRGQVPPDSGGIELEIVAQLVHLIVAAKQILALGGEMRALAVNHALSHLVQFGRHVTEAGCGKGLVAVRLRVRAMAELQLSTSVCGLVTALNGQSQIR
eukprot:Amastigsp_a510044_173.p2 type:complete len:101 gc:universal Amastigsp_a510044_173:735-433(-)